MSAHDEYDLVRDPLSCWQTVGEYMDGAGVDPDQLAEVTGGSLRMIKAGLAGRDELMTLGFLRKCVVGLGHLNSRPRQGKSVEGARPEGELSEEDCLAALEPPSAMPPEPGRFWERQGTLGL